MDNSDSQGIDPRAARALAEAIERRRRASETPWDETPLGRGLADEIARAKAASTPKKDRAAIKRGVRNVRLYKRREARRMTLAKYQNQLERRTHQRRVRELWQATASENAPPAVTMRRPAARGPHARRHRGTAARRARAPGGRSEPDPPPLVPSRIGGRR